MSYNHYGHLGGIAGLALLKTYQDWANSPSNKKMRVGVGINVQNPSLHLSYNASNIHMTHGTVSQAGEVKVVKFNHKPRKPLSGSKYDRTNCLHGTFSCVTEASTESSVGEQLWDYAYISSPAAKFVINDGSFFNTLNSLMLEKMSPQGDTDGPARLVDDETNYVGRKKLEIVWQQIEYQFCNNHKHSTTLILHDFVCKTPSENSTDAQNAPLQLASNVLGVEGDVTTDTYDIPDIYDPSYVLKSDSLSKFWKKVNKVVIHLAPGEQVIYKTFHRIHYEYDRVLERSIDANPRIPNVTKCLVINAKGNLVKQNDGGTNKVSMDGSIIDYTTKVRTFVRERKPFYEKFNLKCYEEDLAVGNRADFFVVEEESPAITTGI